jgi:two-component system cell cycle sensor histidine kinase/response regulator CckA
MTDDRESEPTDVASLVTSEARLRRAQRVARLGSWELDLRSGVMWGSDEAFRIYGLTRTPDNSLPYEVVKGVPLPEHRPELDDALSALLREGAPYEVRFRIRRLDDGEIRHIHSFAEVARDPSGAPARVTGTVQDVTEYEEAHRALRDALKANEERALLILEQAADAIFVRDADGGFVQVNEQACRLTGFDREELLGGDFRLLFHPEVLAAEPLRKDLLDRGETVIRERMLTRKDGSEAVIEMRSTRLSDGSYQSILRDISDRRRLEEQLHLRQRMDSLGTLAGGIAHDFNNILAAIVGSADSLRLGDNEVASRDRVVGNILQACRRAADLVRGLQMLTRPSPLEHESFDLYSVASEVFRVLEETTNRLINKEMAIPEGCYPVVGNPSAIYHALMNLGINAIQAIEEKGPGPEDVVRIEATDHVVGSHDRLPLGPGDYVRITVRDTGVGMSPEVKNRAFDLLFTTKEKGERKGQGLGLTIVYNVIVRHHKGAIDIDSVEGEGTAVHLYLRRGSMPIAEAPPSTPIFRGGDETILVVEDEPEIAALTREVLTSFGYTVLTAADGLEAVDAFRENRDELDLVILDRTLPKLSGEEVLRQMQELDPGVKVIVSSGDTTVDLSLFPGALCVLHKPYRLATFFDTIRDAFDR